MSGEDYWEQQAYPMSGAVSVRERPHEDHVHIFCFVCGWAHVKGKDCEYACYW